MKTFKNTLFLDFRGYTPKQYFNLQLWFCIHVWRLSDTCIHLTIKVVSAKAWGVVNQVWFRRGYDFMLPFWRSFKDPFCIQIWNSLFQALCLCGRLKKPAGEEQSLVEKEGIPDPARSWSHLLPTRFFDHLHWPRAWNRLNLKWIGQILSLL